MTFTLQIKPDVKSQRFQLTDDQSKQLGDYLKSMFQKNNEDLAKVKENKKINPSTNLRGQPAPKKIYNPRQLPIADGKLIRGIVPEKTKSPLER